jgi:hypothetical protein
LVYSTIDKEPFDFATLVERLRQRGLTPDGRAIEHSLARLELGFVLGRNDLCEMRRQPSFRWRLIVGNPLGCRVAPRRPSKA